MGYTVHVCWAKSEPTCRTFADRANWKDRIYIHIPWQRRSLGSSLCPSNKETLTLSNPSHHSRSKHMCHSGRCCPWNSLYPHFLQYLINAGLHRKKSIATTNIFFTVATCTWISIDRFYYFTLYSWHFLQNGTSRRTSLFILMRMNFRMKKLSRCRTWKLQSPKIFPLFQQYIPNRLLHMCSFRSIINGNGPLGHTYLLCYICRSWYPDNACYQLPCMLFP